MTAEQPEALPRSMLKRMRRLRSLRHRALLTVAIVVLAPLGFVWLSDISDASAGIQMRLRVSKAAARSAELALSLDGAGRDRAIDELAARKSVRIRLLDEQGEVVLDRDHEAAEGIAAWAGDLFFGPDGAPTLQDWDARQAPLEQRDEIATAREKGEASGCLSTDGHKLLVCQAVHRVDGEDGGVQGFVHVQESSRRAIRALYDLRYQMVKLTLFVLAMGLAIGWWLGWRWVRPVEKLRFEVLQRKRSRRLDPVPVDRSDEFGDLASAFNELLADLDARDRANEAFAADLVHEIKNPVAAIRAAANALESGRPLDEDRARRLARVLRGSSGRLDVLASQFLDLARAEAGLSKDERENIDLAQLATALVETAGGDARFEGVRFEVDASGPAPVSGVAERLETAVRNLVENAAQHAVTGEGKALVRVSVCAKGGDVRLVVADTGPGIPDDDLPRVFERFFSRRHGGTGLGLALTRAIVGAHGGTVSVHNDGGAVFTVLLPRA